MIRLTIDFKVTDEAALTAAALDAFDNNGGDRDKDYDHPVHFDPAYQFFEIIPDVPGMEILHWSSKSFPAVDWHEQHRRLTEDGWRQGRDGLWRNDRFGGSYKTENALKRIGSVRGEVTREED